MMFDRFLKLLLHEHNVTVGGVFLFGGEIKQSKIGFFDNSLYRKIPGKFFYFLFLIFDLTCLTA